MYLLWAFQNTSKVYTIFWVCVSLMFYMNADKTIFNITGRTVWHIMEITFPVKKPTQMTNTGFFNWNLQILQFFCILLVWLFHSLQIDLRSTFRPCKFVRMHHKSNFCSIQLKLNTMYKQKYQLHGCKVCTANTRKD